MLQDSPGAVPAADLYTIPTFVVVHKEIQENENKGPTGKLSISPSRGEVPKTEVNQRVGEGAGPHTPGVRVPLPVLPAKGSTSAHDLMKAPTAAAERAITQFTVFPLKVSKSISSSGPRIK
jgi:hypothetical protein